MKSVREFANEIGVDVQTVNNSLVRRGIEVIENFEKHDGFFSMSIYEDYMLYLEKYRNIADSFDIQSNSHETVPLWAANTPVVYALTDGSSIVYVGQSVTFFYRVNEHIKTKSFNKLFIAKIDKCELDIIEMILILKYKPIYNVDGSPFSLMTLVLKNIL